MKRLTIILLVPIMLLQSCAGLLIMTAFYANQEEIAKIYCMYRNTRMAPMCGGQCVLTKELKKEQEREDKRPELKFKEFQLNTEFAYQNLIQLPTSEKLNFREPTVEKPLFYRDPYYTSIFHPPLA